MANSEYFNELFFYAQARAKQKAASKIENNEHLVSENISQSAESNSAQAESDPSQTNWQPHTDNRTQDVTTNRNYIQPDNKLNHGSVEHKLKVQAEDLFKVAKERVEIKNDRDELIKQGEEIFENSTQGKVWAEQVTEKFNQNFNQNDLEQIKADFALMRSALNLYSLIKDDQNPQALAQIENYTHMPEYKEMLNVLIEYENCLDAQYQTMQVDYSNAQTVLQDMANISSINNTEIFFDKTSSGDLVKDKLIEMYSNVKVIDSDLSIDGRGFAELYNLKVDGSKTEVVLESQISSTEEALTEAINTDVATIENPTDKLDNIVEQGEEDIAVVGKELDIKPQTMPDEQVDVIDSSSQGSEDIEKTEEQLEMMRRIQQMEKSMGDGASTEETTLEQ